MDNGFLNRPSPLQALPRSFSQWAARAYAYRRNSPLNLSVPDMLSSSISRLLICVSTSASFHAVDSSPPASIQIKASRKNQIVLASHSRTPSHLTSESNVRSYVISLSIIAISCCPEYRARAAPLLHPSNKMSQYATRKILNCSTVILQLQCVQHKTAFRHPTPFISSRDHSLPTSSLTSARSASFRGRRKRNIATALIMRCPTATVIVHHWVAQWMRLCSEGTER